MMNSHVKGISMAEVTHPQLVAALVKAPGLIIAQMNEDKMDLIHAVLGISGEAGELLDGIKKAAIYDKPIDLENVIEELGDLEFYMEQLRQRLGITREQTLAANIAKLSKRYEGLNYSDAAAQNRADKAPETQRKPFPGEPRTSDMDNLVEAERNG